MTMSAIATPVAQLPFVSVIVPHLNDHERLKVCLELLHAQSYPAELMEIIVVDNGSALPIDDLVAPFPLARAAFEAERGCGSARNRGVVLSRGEILAFTDSDCRPDRDWLGNAVRRLIDNEGLHIAGGEIKVFAADESNPTDFELFEKVFGFEQRRYVNRKHFAAGANIVTTRKVFDAVGNFENGELPEDLEWGRRAHAMGFTIGFVGDAVIRHPARSNWTEIRKKIDRTTYHSRNLMRGKSLFALRWLLFTLVLAVPPVDKAWQIAVNPDLPGAGFKLRALRALLRARYYRVAQMAAGLVDPDSIGRERFEG